jgi:hypothetical protein
VAAEKVETRCATFTSRGARITSGAGHKPWGYPQFTLEDLNGHRLTFFELEDGEA